jgi:BolA family transcriptional regulator, general stress-responsive regulator
LHHDLGGAEQQGQAGAIGRCAVSADRLARIRARLAAEFSPLELDVRDESHLHEGHAGAAGGAGHFRIRIVAEAFRGRPPLARHRLIYAALSDFMPGEIHALAIEALPPAG